MPVDAPTLLTFGVKIHENMIPPKADRKYVTAICLAPRPFSNPDPITIVEKQFNRRWMKLAWRKTGVIRRQICPY